MKADPEFVSEDARKKKPEDVVVGDFFIFKGAKYTVVAIDQNLLYYSFVGYRFEHGQGTAQMITNKRGTKAWTKKIDV